MSSLAVCPENVRSGRAAEKPPPAAPLPSAIQTLAFWRHPHAYLQWCHRRYGSTFTIAPMGKPPLVFMSEPSDIKAIVKAPATVLHPGVGASVIEPLVGVRSFMIAEEDEHLEGRRRVLPVFHHRRVCEHVDMVKETVAREVATWPRDTPGPLHFHLRALTLRVILRTIFEQDDERVDELHRRLLAMLSVTGSLALQEPQLRRLPRWRGMWKRFLAHRAGVDRLLTSLIESEAHARARDDGALAMLLGSPMAGVSDTNVGQVRDTLMSLILAGHETTAGELAWALQLLAYNPSVTDQLVDDVDRGGESYLTAVIHEVLRHRPVFLFTIPRAVRHPFEVSARTYCPPVHLVGCVHLMHHDPQLYPRPHTFAPERFLDTSPAPDIWMPWGGGRKRCPGHHLAFLEMRVVLETVLSQLELRPAGRRMETARWRSVIVTPERGCRVELRQRSARRLDRVRFPATQGVHS